MNEADLSALLDETRAFLRAHLSGELQFDEHIRPVDIVISHDGRVVGPVMVAMLEAANTVLFLPQADEDALQIMVTLEKFDEEGDAGDIADRWRIYHGEPEDVRWAFFHVDAAKYRGAVIDGEALMQPNPLRAVEARLCKKMNKEHRESLQALLRERESLEIEAPVMVGIDPWGIDVRGPFDIVRLSFDEPHHDPDGAEAHLEHLVSNVRAG